MIKKIKIGVLFVALLGLIAELVALVDWSLTKSVIFILNFCRSLNLSFFQFDFLQIHNFDTGATFNYVNTLFYVLLLTGLLLFHVSKEKEARLLRFIVSIIFISNIIAFLGSLLSPVYVYKYIQQTSQWLQFATTILIGLVKSSIFIYLAFVVIKYFNATKQLQVVSDEYKESDNPIYEYASLWQRLAHLIIDAFVILFVFSQFFLMLLQPLLETMEQMLSERLAAQVVFLISAILYYITFEFLIGVTPAKLLTECRVLTDENKTLTFSKALVRTVSRYIPFEPLSFFGSQGWHDQLSSTSVVREVRTGKKARWYFLIFPALVVLGVGIYFGNNQYKSYMQFVNNQLHHEKEYATLTKQLNHLTTNSIIKIQDVNNEYSSTATYLKVEEITKTEIICALIQCEDRYNVSCVDILKTYNERKENLSLIPIKRSDLFKSITADYKQYESGKKNTSNLLFDDKQFEITEIINLYQPSIEDAGTGSSNSNRDQEHTDYLSLEFSNRGWPAKLVSIESNNAFKWQIYDSIIQSNSGYSSSSFSLTCSNYTKGEPYAFTFTVVDSLKHKYSYKVEGKNLKRKFTQLDN